MRHDLNDQVMALLAPGVAPSCPRRPRRRPRSGALRARLPSPSHRHSWL